MSPNQPTTIPSPPPIEATRSPDPGDETQRNFRYQHAYGVILIASAIRGDKPYVAIWCEHHEDYLAELPGGELDAFQVKTRTPESGAWRTTDDGFRDSVRRFARLEVRANGRINSYHFVSNTECLDSDAVDKRDKSPCRLVEICATSQIEDLPRELAAAFEVLRTHCDCDKTVLLNVLRKLRLVKGPGRDSFGDEVSHTHLSTLPQCRGFSASELNRVRDVLLQLIHAASALQVDDPAKHWTAIDGQGVTHPRLAGKRVRVDDVVTRLAEFRTCPFSFHPAEPLLELSKARPIRVLQKKFARADLVEQVDTMARRARAAERHLLELAHLRPDEADAIVSQLTNIVKGECDEALLAASAGSEPFGRPMLVDVLARLRGIAATRAQMVYQQEPECLIGVAGLLTEECKVWWSRPFELEEP